MTPSDPVPPHCASPDSVAKPPLSTPWAWHPRCDAPNAFRGPTRALPLERLGKGQNGMFGKWRGGELKGDLRRPAGLKGVEEDGERERWVNLLERGDGRGGGERGEMNWAA